MKLRKLEDFPVAGKTVLLRVDYNVPLYQKNSEWQVKDKTRIVASLDTIRFLQKQNCKTIILTKAGRPDGKVVEELRLDPQHRAVEQLLGSKVKKLPISTGPVVTKAVGELNPGQILMLENSGFEPGESKNDKDLARFWSGLVDVVVNDAFPTSHRVAASLVGVAEFVPMVAGLQLQKEVEVLSQLMTNPKRPFVTIVGGAKISDKVEVIRNLAKIADVVLVGGGVANNFLKAEGINVHHSYLEEKGGKTRSFVAVADELLEATKREKMLLNGYIPLPRIIYPSDVMVGKNIEHPGQPKLLDLTDGDDFGGNKSDHDKTDNDMFLDIGPHTQRLYRDIILEAGSIFWNGPMGVFELDGFDEGTRAVALAMAKSSGFSVVGGGDTISAINQFGVADRFDYISTAGGAALEFLAGVELPGIKPMVIK